MTTVKKIRAQFNPVFREANRSRLRYRVLMGGAGSGKSYNLAQDYVIRLSDPQLRGANLLVCRKVDEANRYSTFAELCGAVRRTFGADWERYWIIRHSPMSLKSRVTGNEIVFRGMADMAARERVKSLSFSGGKLCFIWLEEATEFTREDVEILDDRLRGALSNPNLFYQLTLSFNPVSAHHWIKRRFFDQPQENVLLCRSTYRDNRFIDPGFHQRMMERKARDPEGYRVYGLGEWGESSGCILTDYAVEEFSTDPARFDAMAIGQDFGYNHANAILLLAMKDGELFICAEIYERGKDTAELIRLAEERGLSHGLRMWCDSAEPDRIRTWQRAGFRAFAVKKEPGSILAQIDWLKRRRIHVHASCENTLREMRAWQWAKAPGADEWEDRPADGFDDAMAALRYGIEGWRHRRENVSGKERT